MNNFNINKRIKILRTEILKNEKGKKYSTSRFAQILNVSTGVIENIELLRVEAKDYIIKLICLTFNVREEWLRDGVEPIFSEDKENRNILEDLERQGVRPSVLSLLEAYLTLDDKSKKVFDEYLDDFVEKRNKKLKSKQ